MASPIRSPPAAAAATATSPSPPSPPPPADGSPSPLPPENTTLSPPPISSPPPPSAPPPPPANQIPPAQPPPAGGSHPYVSSPKLAPPPPLPPPASSPPPPETAAATETESLTLALALALPDDTTISSPQSPPPPPVAKSPALSPPRASPTPAAARASALTIAKVLSGEGLPAAAETVAVAKAVAGSGGAALGSNRWLLGGMPATVRRAEIRRAELGFRVSALVLCLISLSVMAADSTPGWDGDSFRRYDEYRYSLATCALVLTYSAFQVVSEVHYIVAGRHIIRGSWRGHFNLAMDQILAYVLLSASSAALSRNGVWTSRFGGDDFSRLINVSASMAFLAFIALAASSVISAYNVFRSIS